MQRTCARLFQRADLNVPGSGPISAESGHADQHVNNELRALTRALSKESVHLHPPGPPLVASGAVHASATVLCTTPQNYVLDWYRTCGAFSRASIVLGDRQHCTTLL